jgi:predicted dinucleotide-binding enzyme
MNAPAVGLVGTGTMGTAVALRLLETGAQVIATSRGAASRSALATAAAGVAHGLQIAPSAAVAIVRALARARVPTPTFTAAATWLDELARRDGELDPAAVLTLLEAELPLDRESAGAAA